MNFKKVSMLSIGLGVLLFSCGGGKVEYTREMMQTDISTYFDMAKIQAKYTASKKVKVTGTLENEGIEKIYTLKDDCIKEDEDGMQIIELIDDKDPDNPFSMLILNQTSFDKLPLTTKFYKINDGYSMSATEGGVIGVVTFDKEFVSTTMEATVDGENMSITYSYLG